MRTSCGPSAICPAEPPRARRAALLARVTFSGRPFLWAGRSPFRILGWPSSVALVGLASSISPALPRCAAAVGTPGAAAENGRSTGPPTRGSPETRAWFAHVASPLGGAPSPGAPAIGALAGPRSAASGAVPPPSQASGSAPGAAQASATERRPVVYHWAGVPMGAGVELLPWAPSVCFLGDRRALDGGIWTASTIGKRQSAFAGAAILVRPSSRDVVPPRRRTAAFIKKRQLPLRATDRAITVGPLRRARRRRVRCRRRPGRQRAREGGRPRCP